MFTMRITYYDLSLRVVRIKEIFFKDFLASFTIFVL